MQFYIYIMANATNTTIYTGVTNNLVRRVYEHKNDLSPDSFTARYSAHKLVFFEATPSIEAAIAREKQIKGWNRKRKNKYISQTNPTWRDLYPDIL